MKSGIPADISDVGRRVHSALSADVPVKPVHVYAFAISIAALALVMYPIFLFERFDYLHAWVTAHFAVMAKAFLENGVVALGGVPIHNNNPITNEPDVYLNWPPLFPIVLSQVFALAGVTERVVHTAMVAIQLANATLIYLIARRLFTWRAGCIAALAFLLLPIIGRYGHIALHLHFAMLLLLVSLYCAYRGWMYRHADSVMSAGKSGVALLLAGAVSFAAAVFTSWEPTLAIPGLAAAALATRHAFLKRLVISYAAAGGIALAFTGWLYASRFPFFLHTIKYRIYRYTGISGFEPLGDLRVHDITLVNTMRPGSPLGASPLELLANFVGRLEMLGIVGVVSILAALIILPAIRNTALFRQMLVIVLPLASVWLGWAAVMPLHYYIHEYQLVLAAPLTAVCVGLLFHVTANEFRLFGAPIGRRIRFWVWVAIPIVMLVNRLPVDLIQYALYRPMENELVQMGEALERETAEGSIVITSAEDMVPVYYSNRHVIKGIEDGRLFYQHSQRIRALCLECEFYVAVFDSETDGFASLIARNRVIWRGEWGMIVRVEEPGVSGPQPASDSPAAPQ